MQRRGLLVLGGALLAGGGVALVLVAFLLVGGGSGLPRSLARIYAYDASAPLHEAVRVIPNRRIPVVVHDVRFDGAEDREVSAYVCTLRGNAGSLPGVVFVPGSYGHREDFLVECIELAARGAVVMSMVTPFIGGADSGPSAAVPSAFFYRRRFEDDAVAIRRCFDLLERRWQADPHRLALAGYSLGAALSSVVAGVDPRLEAVGLVVPPSHAHFIPPPRGRTRAEVYRILAPVDPKRYLPHARAKLFIEMARYDEIETRPEQRAVIGAAAGAEVRWYPTAHSMNARAWNDLVSWLGRRLRLGPLPKSLPPPA